MPWSTGISWAAARGGDARIINSSGNAKRSDASSSCDGPRFLRSNSSESCGCALLRDLTVKVLCWPRDAWHGTDTTGDATNAGQQADNAAKSWQFRCRLRHKLVGSSTSTRIWTLCWPGARLLGAPTSQPSWHWTAPSTFDAANLHNIEVTCRRW